MTDSGRLRTEAERLRERAEKLEAEERAKREAYEALTPEQRVADLLHRHFQRGYPGAGGAMDGGDPWYYEDWGGFEHARFVRMARDVAERWGCPMGEVQARLEALSELLGPYTAQGARRKARDYAERHAGYERENAHKALEKALDAVVDAAQQARQT